MGALSFGLARSEGRYVDCSPSSPSPLHLCRRCLTAALDDAVRLDQDRSEEHTSELQSRGHLVCRLLLHPPHTSTLFPYTTLFRSHENEPLSHDSHTSVADPWVRSRSA